MTVGAVIKRAEAVLPGIPAPEGEDDPRWQAMILLADFIPTEPEAIWTFVERWGKHPNEDLRAGVACVLLEHLLEYHFGLIFPRAERLALKSKRFSFTLAMCSKFGTTKEPINTARFEQSKEKLRKPVGCSRHLSQKTGKRRR